MWSHFLRQKDLGFVSDQGSQINAFWYSEKSKIDDTIEVRKNCSTMYVHGMSSITYCIKRKE